MPIGMGTSCCMFQGFEVGQENSMTSVTIWHPKADKSRDKSKSQKKFLGLFSDGLFQSV